MNKIQENLNKRIIGLFETIRSAERSRCLAAWIGDHADAVNKVGHGALFAHIQQAAYSDFIVNTIAVFEPPHSKFDINSFPVLFDFICQNRGSIEVQPHLSIAKKYGTHGSTLCCFVADMKKKLPA
jgi:hypothetical protein